MNDKTLVRWRRKRPSSIDRADSKTIGRHRPLAGRTEFVGASREQRLRSILEPELAKNNGTQAGQSDSLSRLDGNVTSRQAGCWIRHFDQRRRVTGRVTGAGLVRGQAGRKGGSHVPIHADSSSSSSQGSSSPQS